MYFSKVFYSLIILPIPLIVIHLIQGDVKNTISCKESQSNKESAKAVVWLFCFDL